MKKIMLLLAAVLTVAALEPTPSSADACNPYHCLFLIDECERSGGTVLSLNAVNSCTSGGNTYTAYTILCQVPPATFWDEVCFM